MTDPFFFEPNEILPCISRKRRRATMAPRAGCADCVLKSACKSPKMEPYGKGLLSVAIVGEQPGETEDEEGKPFVGLSGQLEREILGTLDDIFVLDMDRDFITLNAIQCFSKKKPPPSVRLSCLPRVRKQLHDIKPRLILCLGGEAASSVLGRKMPISKIRGQIAVSREYQCWVMATYHPAYLMRQKQDEPGDDLRNVVERDMMTAFEYLDKDVMKRFINEDKGNHWVTDEDKAIDVLTMMAESDGPVAFDYETNQLSPFDDNAEVILVGLADCAEEGWSLIAHPNWVGFREAMAIFLRSSVPKLAHNAPFETNWSRKVFGQVPRNLGGDSMVTAHVLDERRWGTKSLDWQTFVHFGSNYKQEHGKPINIVADMATGRYNSLDARYCWALNDLQREQMPNAVKRGEIMFCSAIPVLSDMTYKGIKVDPERLATLRQKAREQIRDAEQQLVGMDAVRQTEIRTARMFTFSEDDLRTLFYKELGLPTLDRYKTEVEKKPSIGIEALQAAAEESGEDYAEPYLKCLARRSEWEKLLSTYVEPFLNMRDKNDLLHPSIMLHTTRSFRSSSEGPNIQNVPHHGQFAHEVRRCIVPKLDLFLADDYSGMEIRIIASVSGDEQLLDDLERGIDLHRFWASQIFELPEDKITDKQRFKGKNGFVFPLFYGASWKLMCHPPLSLPAARSRSLTKKFWKRYAGVKRWQNSKIEQYHREGWIDLVSGFRRHAPLDLLQIGNTPVQGPAFHVLLENLVRLWHKMRQRKMRSHAVAEAHDDTLFDVAEDEADELVALATKTLKRLPDWLPTPVELEVEWQAGEDWGSMEKL